MEPFLAAVRPWVEAALGLCAVGYLGAIAWMLRGMRYRAEEGVRPPGATVVVAARDESERIDACLDGLLGQVAPPEEYEVIVVDDGSTDDTADRVRRRMGAGVPLRLLSAAERLGRPGSKKAALGLGIAAARGEVILVTDADCRVPPTWVRGMAGRFGPSVGMVVGFSQVGEPGAALGAREGWEALDFLCLMAAALGGIGQGRPLAASGQSLAFRRAAFDQVGGYREVAHRASGDDVLLLQLIRRCGCWRIAFAPHADTAVTHPPSPSWRALWRQRVRWASNAPLQARLDPAFFAYLAAVFGQSLLLCLAPLLVLAGALGPAWGSGAWAAKIGAEWVLARRAAARFGRRDLLRHFPAWTLTQPFYVVAMGVLGSLGRFRWKGQPHAWGRALPPGPV